MLPTEAPCSDACTPCGSHDTSGPCGDRQASFELRPKSAKRRAAETLLQCRYTSPALAAGGGGGSGGGTAMQPRTEEQRPSVHVAACSDCSSGCGSGCTSSAEAWCSQDVALPQMDWAALLQPVLQEGDVAVDHAAQCYRLPGGVCVHVVSALEQLPGALTALRHSMQDACVAIDLEWKPKSWAGNGPSRVALMQLASATVAVLVRVCRLAFRMPPSLRAFLSDPELTFVGFSWDSSDEHKMQQTFGEGRHDLFARFLDLQQLSKGRKVTMSNWEVKQLTAKQVRYAALDAIVTGNVYRGLRLWHASPSACTSCRQMLGVVLRQPTWRCHDCSRSFSSSAALQSHQHQKKHGCSTGTCGECGRVCVPPSLQAKAGA